MLKNYFPHILSAVILFICSAGSVSADTGSGEQLIVFIQNKDSSVEAHFKRTLLPVIKTSAEELGVSLTVYDGTKGFPGDVTITPMIVYQNSLGRSVYQGRTTGIKRIKNFIRTSRRLPQGKKPLVLKQIPVLKYGRSKIWSPVKVSPLSGAKPEGYSEQAFIETARKSIFAGFKRYETAEEEQFGRGDRGFYMDFYPWCSDDGTLFLSLALFSQFHCKDPVFRLSGETLKGNWKNRDILFKKAAAIMEEAVLRSVNNPFDGDGFIAVSEKTKVAGWKEIGFSLPKQKETNKLAVTNPPALSNSWTASADTENAAPAIQFRFPAPLDNYLGEAGNFTCTVTFPENKSLYGIKGNISVDTDSVTMGDDDLDKTIKGILFLDSDAYPTATFKIKKTEGFGNFEFGELNIVNTHGDFQLKDKSLPMSLPLTFEAIIDDEGEPVLVVTGSFEIDLRDFEIEGAAGPAPEKYTLLFDINLFLSPE